MTFVYIIYSQTLDKFYIGCTSDIEKRLEKHNGNHKGFTGKVNDWRLVYKEEYINKTDALKRERQIKKKKSKKYILFLINKNN